MKADSSNQRRGDDAPALFLFPKIKPPQRPKSRRLKTVGDTPQNAALPR
jgi:hypothetical protein